MDIWSELGRYQENGHVEAKQALGGLPESLWETYSAFANTDGGVILLGVAERADKSLEALELLDPQWLIDDLWAILNDPRRVSVNLLRRDDVQVIRDVGKCIIAVFVPRADAAQRPVYVGGDPWRGTYRREGEADKSCTRAEIEAMLAARG